MKKIKQLLGLLALSAALFTACNQNVNTENEEKKLVKLNVQVTADTRTALPDFDLDIDNLTDVNMYCSSTAEDLYIHNYSSNYDFSWYSTSISDLTSSTSLTVPEGPYYFRLSAYYNYVYYEAITYSEVTEENNTLNFSLVPSYYSSSSFNGNVSLKFNFPEGTNPVLNSLKWERYMYDDEFDNSGTLYDVATDYDNLKTGLVSGTTAEGIPYIQMNFDVNSGNQNAYYIFNLEFTNQEDEAVTGIFEYSTTAEIYYNKTVSEEYTVEKFLPVQILRYHLTDAKDITDTEDEILTQYYSSAFGYNLYNPLYYDWYEDKACTTRATAQEPGVTGEKDFYWTAEKNKRTLTVKDTENNLIGTYELPNGYSYCLYQTYIKVNGTDYTEVEKEGYYIASYYKDIEKTHYLDTYTSYYLSEDTTIYVYYKPAYTLTVYELNAAADAGPFVTLKITANKYYLSKIYVGSVYDSKYFTDTPVYRYYSDAKGKNVLTMDSWICDVNSDVTIYAAFTQKELLLSSLAETNPWTSDKNASDVETGFYSYTATEATLYYVNIYDNYGKDNYFSVFVNGEYVTSSDSNITRLVDLNKDDVISIKHMLYSGRTAYQNTDSVENYSTEVNDGCDLIELYKCTVKTE